MKTILAAALLIMLQGCSRRPDPKVGEFYHFDLYDPIKGNRTCLPFRVISVSDSVVVTENIRHGIPRVDSLQRFHNLYQPLPTVHEWPAE